MNPPFTRNSGTNPHCPNSTPVYKVLRVTDDGMAPLIPNGSVVHMKKVDSLKHFDSTALYYLVDTKKQTHFCTVANGRKRGEYLIKSLKKGKNDNPEYYLQEVDIHLVFQLVNINK